MKPGDDHRRCRCGGMLVVEWMPPKNADPQGPGMSACKCGEMAYVWREEKRGKRK